jgi:hypothetical protein
VVEGIIPAICVRGVVHVRFVLELVDASAFGIW